MNPALVRGNLRQHSQSNETGLFASRENVMRLPFHAAAFAIANGLPFMRYVMSALSAVACLSGTFAV